MAGFVSSGRERLSGLDIGRHKTEFSGGVHRRYSPGDIIFDSNGESPRIVFLVSGWAVCSKMLSNGTRIVVDFVLRNDMISTATADLAQETVEALSDVVVYEFPDFTTSERWDASQKLIRIIYGKMMMRQVRLSERLATIGRRDALERTGHLFLELATRVGASSSKPNFDGFECPLTQADIGDAVGLSTVHINRVLKDMRLSGLLSFRNGIVEFLDRHRLIELVNFDADYFTERTA